MRLWGKRYGPRQDKARRPLCLLISVLLVIGVVFALFFVIVPSLKDSIVNFVNLLPERILQLQKLVEPALLLPGGTRSSPP